MVGVNIEKYNNCYFFVKCMDFIIELVFEIGIVIGEDKINEVSVYIWVIMGFFGCINYDYFNKYFIVGNLCYDGFFCFFWKDCWGLFGLFFLGWNMVVEDFFLVDENIIN